MAPGSIFYHLSFPIYFILQSLLSIYIIKIPKIFILLLSSLSDLTLASGREGIDSPFIALVARILFVCVGARDSCVASYWIDTLLLKTEGNTYATLLHHPFLFKGKTNASSRGSKKDFWRRCRGVYAKVNLPSTHHKPLSLALHYFPFASRFPLPHFTLAVLFALLPFVLLFARVTMCLLLACIFAS